MENIDKLSKEIQKMLNNTDITIDEQNSLLFSEFIYDFCSWHTGSLKTLQFNNKVELKQAINEYINMHS